MQIKGFLAFSQETGLPNAVSPSVASVREAKGEGRMAQKGSPKEKGTGRRSKEAEPHKEKDTMEGKVESK